MSLNLAPLLANATRAPRAARASATPRGPSLADRFLEAVVAQADAEGLTGRPLPLRALAKAWAAENAPATAERKTPHATIESQIRVAVAAGEVLVNGRVTVQGARDNRTLGGGFQATITVGALTEG